MKKWALLGALSAALVTAVAWAAAWTVPGATYVHYIDAGTKMPAFFLSGDTDAATLYVAVEYYDVDDGIDKIEFRKVAGKTFGGSDGQWCLP